MGRNRLGRVVSGSALTGVAVALAFLALETRGRDAALAALASTLAFGFGALAMAEEPTSPPSRDREASVALRIEAERARRELADLYSAFCHDFRSPLRSVLNFSRMLEVDHGPELDSGAREILVRIRASARAGLALLDGLNRLSRVERSLLHPEMLRVDAIVRDAFAEVKPAEARVDLDVAELPAVHADRALLQAAFEELLANGIKFSARRNRAHVAVTGRSTAGEVVYSVADDGVGFEPRYAGKLFEVFERGHASEEFPGAGIGLAVVRRVAERHGGRVWAEAEPERGARLHLALPRRVKT
jgi:chemotaxis family two-component system sensor kinase Cph1